MMWPRDIAYAVALVLTSPGWGLRLLRTGKWRTDWAARFGRVAGLPADTVSQGAADSTAGPTLLIHAVSVGEVGAVRGLVEHLARARPDLRLVIASTTDTGLARAKSLFAPRHAVVRYPLDVGFAVRRFLDAVRPDAVALTELEVWPNFVEACDRRGIPVAVINGRLSERSFARYRLARPVLRRTFGRLAAAAVQTEAYARRFEAMGVPADRIRVLDSMKWDSAPIDADAAGADALARAIGLDRSRPVIVAGSTAPGEDELLIDTCPPEAQLVLAPRRPEWFDRVASLAPGIVRRTEHPDTAARPADGSRLFLLDTIGELRRAYALADVAIVGRSFLGLYGSDPTEPAALGKPTIIGPHHSDFAETVAALSDAGGLVVTDAPGEAAGRLLTNRAEARRVAEAGRAVILSRRGATTRHADLLLGLVAPA